jgi:hypothetical protein
MKSNKRGMGQVIGIFLLMFILLALAFGGALLVGVSNNIMDEFRPVINELGAVEDNGAIGDNMTTSANYVFSPLDSIVNSFNWILGVVYAFSLFLIIALAVSYRATGEKYLIVLFLLLIVIGLFVSISMSNAYEDLSSGTDDFSTSLQDQTLTSWLIINSPLILIIISFIAGAIMFTGNPEEVFQ